MLDLNNPTVFALVLTMNAAGVDDRTHVVALNSTICKDIHPSTDDHQEEDDNNNMW